MPISYSGAPESLPSRGWRLFRGDRNALDGLDNNGRLRVKLYARAHWCYHRYQLDRPLDKRTVRCPYRLNPKRPREWRVEESDTEG